MLKFVAYTFAGMALVGSVAEARYIGPLLVKEAMTGFVMAEDSKTQKCEIFAQKTVLTTHFGGAGQLVSVETKNQTLDGDYIAVLQKAHKERLVNHVGAVDGPTVRYYGFLINPNDSVTKVTLYDENGGTGQILRNPAPEARVLMNVLDSLCPHTLQGIGPTAVE